MPDQPDDLPPGEDISLEPNYKEGKIWIYVGGHRRRLISPSKARDMANQMEAKFDLEAADADGYQSTDLVDRLRKLAAQVEAAYE